jgi:protein required for attachment to host cells
MNKHLKFLFIVADGGRARFVTRSTKAEDDFATIAEHEAGPPPSGGERTAVFSRFGSGRDTTESGGGETLFEKDYVNAVADQAVALAKAQSSMGVVLIAPPKLIASLKHALAGKVVIVGELAKDLTKTPDHQLGDWLRSLELEAGAASQA